MQFGKLALRSGFITVFTQLSMLAAALPPALLLPPDLVKQLFMTVPLMLLLMLYALPKFAARLFFPETRPDLELTGFGASCFAAVVFVGIGFVLLFSSGFATLFETQLISLLSLFVLNLYIAARWLI